MKHKRDDGPEKQEDEAVDVTPVMICVFVVMCCSMLVLLYYFYDQLGAPPAHQRDAEARTPAHRSRVPPPPACGVPLEKSVGGANVGRHRQPGGGDLCSGNCPSRYQLPATQLGCTNTWSPFSGGGQGGRPRWPPALNARPTPPRSLCDHRDLLPVLLHGPLQLPVSTGPEAAVRQMSVSPPRENPARPCTPGAAR